MVKTKKKLGREDDIIVIDSSCVFYVDTKQIIVLLVAQNSHIKWNWSIDLCFMSDYLKSELESKSRLPIPQCSGSHCIH